MFREKLSYCTKINKLWSRNFDLENNNGNMTINN